MAGANDEIYKLILQIEGKQQAEELKEQIAATEERISSLYQKMKSNPTQFRDALRADAEALSDLQGKLKLAESAAAGGAGANRNLGRSLLEVSRAAEDAQYGIGGVLNNIPGLIQSLGGGAGLIGAISLVAVGAAQIYKHWDDLAGLWGGGATKTEAERMEELRKKTEKTADEMARLAKFEKDRRDAEEQHKPTDKEQKQNAAVNDALRNAPIKEVEEAMDKLRGGTIRNSVSADAEQKLADAKKALDDELHGPKTAPERAERERKDPFEFLNELAGGPRARTTGEVNIAKAQAEIQKRQADVDAEYVAQRQKQINLIANNPEAMEKFLAQADQAGVLNAGQQKALREATHPGMREEDDAEAHFQKEENANAVKRHKFREESERAAWDEEVRTANIREKQFDDEKALAKKTKSFVGTGQIVVPQADGTVKRLHINRPDSELTPGELAAKREYERDEFAISQARSTRSYVGKENDQLTPYEKEAKDRNEKLSKEQIKKAKKELDVHTELDPQIEQSLIGRQLAGFDSETASKDVIDQAAKVFQTKFSLGADDAKELAKDRVHDAQKRLRDEVDKEPEKKNSETVGIREYIDKLQGSITNKDDIPKSQLACLKAIYDKISETPAARDRLLASFG